MEISNSYKTKTKSEEGLEREIFKKYRKAAGLPKYTRINCYWSWINDKDIRGFDFFYNEAGLEFRGKIRFSISNAFEVDYTFENYKS